MPGRHTLLDRSDVRTILSDLARQMAPGDVTAMMAHEAELRSKAARLHGEDCPLLADQLTLALDCLHDHVAGSCPQIPYYTISLLAGAVCYFTDVLDVIPDFLPHIGRLDDAAVMALACQLARDGLQRYCAWKGRDLKAVLGAA
ncbi:MAG: YkvA family protein [Candidatus Binatia bacterium]